MTGSSDAPPPPRWIAPWLALLAPLYVVSPVALLGLPWLRRLPTPALWLLGFYAVSQQVPALFTPEPLAASLLALARTLLMFGLIGVGAALGNLRRLSPLAIGLAVVYVSAVLSSALGAADLFAGRLNHPYMTPITLGLAGALGLWIAFFSKGELLWRLPLGLVGLGILLLSGSRGPLAGAMVGCVLGFLAQTGRRTALALLVGAGLLAGGLYAGERLGVNAVGRLSSADTTGRDIVWYNTLTVMHTYPWSGVGSYRLGNYLAPGALSCTLFPDPQGEALPCPTWVAELGNPWLIAHNVTLQALAETGPLGFGGLALLLVAVAWSAVVRRQPLGLAIVGGLLLTTITDNTLLVPSPFFAEVFWIVAGWHLARLPHLTVASAGAGTLLLLILSAPIVAQAVRPTAGAQTSAGLTFFSAAREVSGRNDYRVYVRFKVPPGTYRASLNACFPSCMAIDTQTFQAGTQGAELVVLRGILPEAAGVQMELRLHPGRSSFSLRPIGRYRWTLKEQTP